jgi:hypothetical protein
VDRDDLPPVVDDYLVGGLVVGGKLGLDGLPLAVETGYVAIDMDIDLLGKSLQKKVQYVRRPDGTLIETNHFSFSEARAPSSHLVTHPSSETNHFSFSEARAPSSHLVTHPSSETDARGGRFQLPGLQRCTCDCQRNFGISCGGVQHWTHTVYCRCQSHH